MKAKLLIVLTNIAIVVNGYAQGTAFTYQGRLLDSTNPANGSYDFTFTIFGTNNGGIPITQTITNASVPINNGLFTSMLDFGNFLNGSPAWLEISVRSNGNGSFTTLIPRQQLTPTPYATFANVASNVIGAINGSLIATGSIGSSQLAAGAAAANLQTSGQGLVPSGGVILSTNSSDSILITAGYVNLGKLQTGGAWQTQGGGPTFNAYGSAVWTGSEIIFWVDGTGWRYNPQSNVWKSISANGVPTALSGHTAVWTGTEMIIWGGWDGTTNVYTGARYNPVSDTWIAVNTNGAPSRRQQHTAVWTGSNMIVWGGLNGTYYTGSDYIKNDGACYDPVADQWTPVTSANAPRGRYGHTAIWTGNEMILWGGSAYAVGVLNDGAAYNPVSNSWRNVSTLGAPAPRYYFTSVWTGNEMIVWGGEGNGSVNGQNDGGRYNPSTDTWILTSTNGAPSSRRLQSAIWTGNQMVVWGGFGNSGTCLNDGGILDPTTGGWSPAPSINAPPAPCGSQNAVWTGNVMFIWEGGPSIYSFTPSKDLYFYMKR